ncbi:CDK-activating kinase assembly factor MAT1 isoform X1 [Pseudophryne corroboree]|uniref:CDK-activating kinase assembly factor MAT1 isoform X1 n=1 Tax=Pseudophryne corroboree TaxID=495146 RepID=UPI0030817CDA
MDDLGCPRCKTTKYRNPSLKLMVNVCGHTLCESCVDLLFVRGSGTCQECNTPLRKSNFRVQLFEDPTIDKEVEIRKKILKIYNKREEDFPSLRVYNDFLEEIEEIVFNLTNNMDIEDTKRKIEQYQKENKDTIQRNKVKLTREQEELEEALEVERQENEQRRILLQKEEQLQQKMKRKNKQELLDQLETSRLPASILLAQHKGKTTQIEMQVERAKPTVTFSTGIKMMVASFFIHICSRFSEVSSLSAGHFQRYCCNFLAHSSLQFINDSWSMFIDLSFQMALKKKVKRAISGDCAGHPTSPPNEIKCPGNILQNFC